MALFCWDEAVKQQYWIISEYEVKAMNNIEKLIMDRDYLKTGQWTTVKQAWRHAETHEHGPVLKRLTLGFPHGCMGGIILRR